MADRKVLNKYYPPDFDPSAIQRRRGFGGPRQYKVRLMAPFSMQCLTCRNYIYKGTKFNARKEDAKGEKYHSIQIYRFYIHCPKCSAEITFKTDPGNLDYTCEGGATRNFGSWNEDLDDQEKKERKRKEIDEGLRGKMGELEDRVEASRREVELAEALDEIRTKNALDERVGVDKVIEGIIGRDKRIQEERRKLEEERQEREDEEQARRVFSEKTDDLLLQEHIKDAKLRLGMTGIGKISGNIRGAGGQLGLHSTANAKGFPNSTHNAKIISKNDTSVLGIRIKKTTPDVLPATHGNLVGAYASDSE